MYWVIVIICICVVLFLIWASADVGSNIYLRTICRADCTEKIVALTFDDGPDELMTPRVLDVLKKHAVHATFFLVGKKISGNKELVRRMIEEGHLVANHTFSHKNRFPLASSENVDKELSECDEAILGVTGKRPLLFRPPFGVTNPIIAKAVLRKGYKTIGWSIRSFDTVENKGRDAVCNRIVKNLHPGAVILLHDRCKDADVLLSILIAEIQECGYTIVPLDKMLKINAYEN